MKNMKSTISTLIALFFIAATANVYAQQSDYEIQKNFRAEYKEITVKIDNAVSSADLTAINSEIESLAADYAGYSDLINSALYPDTYEGRMDDLRTRFATTQQNVAMIEQLNERVRELSEEMDRFRSQLTSMDRRTDSLQTVIRQANASERRLANQIRQYRESLDQRDKLVSEFLESLLTKYGAMDSATAVELADAASRMEDDPLGIVKTIIGEYINHANQATGLSASDYLGMKAQHAYFSDVWSNIGQRLAEVFASDRPVQARQEVTDLLATWNSSVESKLWPALTAAFGQNGITLQNFTDKDTFYRSMSMYVDAATEESLRSNSDEDLSRFRAFSSYWNNTVKAEWGEYLLNGNVLTYQQIASIDLKLEGWNEAAVPTSNLMLILFLVAMAVIIGLIVMLVMKK
jgi:uncharacterized coiled-coil protein SlyX